MTSVLEPSMHKALPQASDRSFGLVFAVMFAIVGCWPLVRLLEPRWWSLGVAVGFAAISLTYPRLLHPFNRAWLALGKLLHRVTSPVIMAAIFFFCVTPIGLILRARGRDLLSLSWRTDLSSYWIARTSPDPNTMTRQF